jgi:hypothetical protein
MPKTRILSSPREKERGQEGEKGRGNNPSLPPLALSSSLRLPLIRLGRQSVHDLVGDVKIGMCFAHVVLVI